MNDNIIPNPDCPPIEYHTSACKCPQCEHYTYCQNKSIDICNKELWKDFDCRGYRREYPTWATTTYTSEYLKSLQAFNSKQPKVAATNTTGTQADDTSISQYDNAADQQYDNTTTDYTCFANLADALSALYRRKNITYGNSFERSVTKYGPVAALTRLSDKWNRVENLMLGHDNMVADESLNDTLADLAAYALMTVMALNGKEELEKIVAKLRG